jgi:hypothetical protein
MHVPRIAAVVSAAATILGLAVAPSSAATRTVPDPTGDTGMMRGGPDITSTRTTYGSKRILVVVKHAGSADEAGTITGSVLKFRGGGTYTLQHRFPDPGFGTPETDEVLLGQTSRRVKCKGLSSSTTKSTVSISAPVACFDDGGPALRSKGFSFTRNFDLDDTERSGWIRRG